MPSKLDDYLKNASSKELETLKKHGNTIDSNTKSVESTTEISSSPTPTHANTPHEGKAKGRVLGNDQNRLNALRDRTTAPASTTSSQTQESNVQDSLAKYASNEPSKQQDGQTNQNTMGNDSKSKDDDGFGGR